MYQADAKTYADYGATVLAWGGKPTPESLAQARDVTFFGSVGMVTEFSRYYERFPQSYEQGLCRDVNGQPVKVPWLTDHQHRGIPYWWCCTHQPRFRQYLRERVVETVRAGAQGVHIDDHLGTAGGLWLGLCFCDLCIQGFHAHLKALPPDQRTRLEISQVGDFDFRTAVKAWMASDASKKRTPPQHPLWPEYTVYQCRFAAAFMRELHDLADETAGHRIPMGANAGLLWPHHLSDYRTLDLFSAETDHHASTRRLSDAPLFAYRLADAVDRPYASTASGGDWAYIKEQNLPGLVRGWIALSYAAGHALMAPHRQWCYTPEKGTHWYEGPKEKFAPLYQFVRTHADLFDGYENQADLAVVMPHRAFLRNPTFWFELAGQLAATNVSYRLLLAGDEIVEHRLAAEDLAQATSVLIPHRADLFPADRDLIEQQAKDKRLLTTAAEALAEVRPAVRVEAPGPVRALPRRKAGQLVVHLLNYDYDTARDEVRPLSGVKVRLDAKAFSLAPSGPARLVQPGASDAPLVLRDGAVELPTLGLWALLVVPTQP
jgi:hypothetical protein